MNESTSEPRCAAAELAVQSGRPPGFVFGTRPRAKASPLGPAPDAPPRPPRSRLAYLLLALFVGGSGLHNFYAGRTLSGLLQLLCFVAALALGNLIALAVLGVWLIGDIVLVTRDGSGQPFA